MATEIMTAAPSISNRIGDISSCDSEPVQYIASAQNHGCVLLFSVPDYRIQSASENVQQFLPFNHSEVVGARLEHILDQSFVEIIVANIRQYPWNQTNGRYLTYIRDDKQFDAWLFYSDGLFGIDLEMPAAMEQGATEQIKVDQIIKEYMMNAKTADGLPQLATILAKTIKQLTGIDRIMIYRFLAPNWHGEVIAEDRIAKSHSFMGHRFPASDIPKPARNLYLRNQVRLIMDVNDAGSRLSPNLNPVNKTIIDLSDSRLRAVSPIHLEYLRNMGIKSSYSVAITHGGKLWGLIAGHNLSLCYVSNLQRSACEVVSSAFAAQGPVMEQLKDNETTNLFNVGLRNLFGRLRSSRHPREDLFKQHRLLTEIFSAVGVAYVSKTECDLAGITPPKLEIEKLAKWTLSRMNAEHRDVLAVNDLPVADVKFESFRELASGVLALKVEEGSDAQFMLFRPELSQTITWGGDPRKQLDKKNFQGRINPRTSFEAWEEVLRGYAKPWALFEIEGAMFFRDLIFEGLIKKEQMLAELSEKLHGKM